MRKKFAATIEQWVDFLNSYHTRPKLKPPFFKQKKLIAELFRSDPNKVKQFDLCCGRGYGKSFLSILVSTMSLSLSGTECGLFLAPNWKTIHRVFLKKWHQIVHRDLFVLNKGEQKITWTLTGSVLYYSPRNITGSYAASDDSQLGQDTTFVIDDEAALRCSINFYSNTLATIREPGNIRYYLTLSTPRLGAYKQLVTSDNHKLFRGTSSDNIFLPDGYVEQLRSNMSPAQARREIDGEFESLEGSIWPHVELEKNWPFGNIDTIQKGFDKNKPFYLFCDFGKSTGSYLIVQQRNAYYNGMELFGDPVWVAVADLCPAHDASASRAFQKIKKNFGDPLIVTGGADINKGADTDGRTIANFVNQVFHSKTQIRPVSERYYDKQLQYDRLSYLVCSAKNIKSLGTPERRFTVAENFISLDMSSKRGIIEMFKEDEWPDAGRRRASDFLPKNREITVQHIRDATLMGAVAVMHPPAWVHDGSLTY